MPFTINRDLANGEATDALLIAHIAERDDDAFAQLMHRYKSRLFAFTFKYTRDEEAALDIVQETFARVFSHAKSYNPAYAASTWLFNIALNQCRDYRRRSKLRQFLSLDWMQKDAQGQPSTSLIEQIPDLGENVESLLEIRQNLTLLEKAIDSLPHDLKATLILYHLEEQSQAECALQLGITAKAVETRVYRARKHLREKLSIHFEG